MRPLLLAPLLVLALLLPASAHAYPWMIRHGYTGCASCHNDPSGGSLLTPYGRAQSEILLATRYGHGGGEGEEASPQSGFLFGAVKLPEWLDMAIALRGGGMAVHTTRGTTTVPLLMVSDVRAGVRLGAFRASGALGYAPRDALAASLTRNEANNLVSREHWVGLVFADETLLLRAGRLNLPYGLRNVEHTFWVRDITDTDINQDQQHGLSLVYTGERLRGEVMAIAGNFQLHPDAYRERGYSAYVEWALAERLAVGASSLLTHAASDPRSRAPNLWRMAHGLFARWAPVTPLVLLAEADLTSRSTDVERGGLDPVALLQADVELVQGVHLLGTGELRGSGGVLGAGGWLGAEWFFNPHASVRVDGLVRREPGASAPTSTLLGQLHVNL